MPVTVPIAGRIAGGVPRRGTPSPSTAKTYTKASASRSAGSDGGSTTRTEAGGLVSGAVPSGGTRTTMDPHAFDPTAANSTTGAESGAAVKLTVSAPGPDRIGEVTVPLLARTCTSEVPTGMVTRALRAPAGIDAGLAESARSQVRGAAWATGMNPESAAIPRESRTILPGAVRIRPSVIRLTGAG